MQEYTVENPEIVKRAKVRYAKKATVKANARYNTDPHYRLTMLFRNRLNNLLRRRKIKKTFRSLKYLGCTTSDFREHLESLFKPGMTWSNHGEWHIDHIYPLNKVDFTDEEHLQKYLHYSNMQPLWARENILKRDKI